MSQTLLTPTEITKRALVSLKNNCAAAQRVHRSFENQFVKIGTQLTVRKPNRFTVSDGANLQIQQIAEPSVLVTIDKRKHVDFEFSAADLTLTIEQFGERYINPAMITLANQVDYDVLALATSFSNSVGTAGTTPSTFANSVQLTGQRLDENGAPQDGRTLIVNPAAYWAMAGGQSNAYVTRVSENALIKGYLSEIGNHSVFMDQNVPVLGASVYGGTPLTNAGTAQTGASLITDGWTVSTTILVAGTVFTIDGVYAVNPDTKQSTGSLKNFVVTADTVTDGSGNSTIAISPSIITTGPFQNVTNGAANNKAITVLTGLTTTSHPTNLAFCKQALGLVMVPLEVPKGVHMAERQDYDGISMRLVSDYDITTDVFATRIDIMYGVAKYYDELGCRLVG